MDLSIVNSAEDCKSLVSRDGKQGTSVELTCINRLFSNYFVRVYYENSTNSIEGTGSYVCYQLFSDNYDARHSDALQNN